MGTPIAALKLGEDMRRLILALYAKFLSSDGRTVDYDGIKRSQMFIKYKDVARRLQRVDLDVMISKREEMLSFFINVYNALVIHGTIDKVMARCKILLIEIVTYISLIQNFM